MIDDNKYLELYTDFDKLNYLFIIIKDHLKEVEQEIKFFERLIKKHNNIN
mgnify:CR=1 FL=1|jgi:hypothetical protein